MARHSVGRPGTGEAPEVNRQVFRKYCAYFAGWQAKWGAAGKLTHDLKKAAEADPNFRMEETIGDKICVLARKGNEMIFTVNGKVRFQIPLSDSPGTLYQVMHYSNQGIHARLGIVVLLSIVVTVGITNPEGCRRVIGHVLDQIVEPNSKEPDLNP